MNYVVNGSCSMSHIFIFIHEVPYEKNKLIFQNQKFALKIKDFQIFQWITLGRISNRKLY